VTTGMDLPARASAIPTQPAANQADNTS